MLPTQKSAYLRDLSIFYVKAMMILIEIKILAPPPPLPRVFLAIFDKL